MFTKVLIANRGEIAVRILRACRELGVRSVAVYSEADRRALHVRMADEAVEIGAAEASRSYLDPDRIIQAALQTGAEAIHPGYGFLSENAAFAESVEASGLVFIGPPPASIRLMGDKAAARARVAGAGVPVVPGYQDADDDLNLIRAAKQLGFPILVKAAAGGGGKGIRIANDAGELPEALAAARRESLSAFGSSRLVLERYILQARHIEFQVLGDLHGTMLHVFERECSVQRRHQKVIEETPAPWLSTKLRTEMGASAVAAARAAGYSNAGTVEFIFDPVSSQYYFLEMNTRLQVEHPITEAVAGIDLVHWQLRIASGEAIPFSQAELRQRGHAIECRVYAEDPAAGFLPATGPVLRFLQPLGPGVRVDSGVAAGDEISVYYDPLIAKIITHAEDRAGAIRRMQSALRETVLLGLTNNVQFLQDVLVHPDFADSAIHTTWVEESFLNWEQPVCDLPDEILIAAAVAQLYTSSAASQTHGPAEDDPFSPWKLGNGFRVAE